MKTTHTMVSSFFQAPIFKSNRIKNFAKFRKTRVAQNQYISKKTIKTHIALFLIVCLTIFAVSYNHELDVIIPMEIFGGFLWYLLKE